MIGIYKIESLLKSKRCYVGSAVNIKSRWSQHLTYLKQGKHHSIKLQRHFNKYGEQDLIFIIIELCFPEFLTAREQYYINKLNPYFNTCKIAGSSLGIKHSEETKRKVSEAGKGRHHSEETKRKIGKAQIHIGNKPPSRKGMRLTEEHKRNLRESHLGKKYKLRLA